MRDSDLEPTLEADRKAGGEQFDVQHMQEQHAAGWPRDHLGGKHAQALKLQVDMILSLRFHSQYLHNP
jgi:hypothetical protein